MNSIKEDKVRIVANNREKQDEVKWNVEQFNSVKRAACIIKRGSSCDNIISSVANLLSDTNITEDSNESIFQAILPLSSDTLK